MNLDDLARDPSRVSELKPEERTRLIIKLACLILMLECVEQPERDDPDDRQLSVKQVAEKLNVSEDWVYDRAKTKLASARNRHTGRYSEKQLEILIRQWTGG